jgi:hypothetical protein
MRRARAAYPRIPRIAIAIAASGAAAIALCLASAAGPVRGQDKATMTADAEGAAPSLDAALLAGLGLDLAAVEQADDVALLWRAVRALALPGRVSEATQQRLLRRVWAIDPDIRHGSRIDSPAN